MAIGLTAKIAPLNDAFTGMVDADQIVGGGAAGVLPDATMPDLTGEVTTVAGAVATTIANDAVAYAKMQNVSATDKVLGRATAGAGDVEEIACTSFARSILDDTDEATFKATVNLEANTDFYAPAGTDVAITDGGTGQSTAQLGINALTAVSAATNEHVLTKDTATGNAIFKAGGAGGTPTAITVADTTDTTSFIALFESATGDLGPKTDAGATYNATTGMATFTGITAPHTGDTNLTTSPGSDHTASGVKITLAANENQAFGDACYIASDGQAQLGDADAIATSVVCVMCCDATISANATGNYLLLGIARDDTWAWTVGGVIYLSTTGTTGNTLTQTQPSGTADIIQIAGIATHADRMLFSPQLKTIEHV